MYIDFTQLQNVNGRNIWEKYHIKSYIVGANDVKLYISKSETNYFRSSVTLRKTADARQLCISRQHAFLLYVTINIFFIYVFANRKYYGKQQG